jgi:proline iminopeptidase
MTFSKYRGRTVLLCLLLLPIALSCARSEEAVDLWPSIEPYETGFLRVSDLHEIYYELCGNPEGTAVFVLHGGPGASSSPYMRRFFDPAKFHVVLHDQRGCGQSRPFGEIAENTTDDLVEDIERLREHLGLGKIMLFGGSWGTTLGLAYAETYPDHVCGMLLRGLFTATRGEIDYYYHGGVRTFFPDAYDELIAALPDPDRRPLAAYLADLIQNGDSTTQWRTAKAWTRYEVKIGALLPSTDYLAQLESPSPSMAKGAYSLGLFENYYMAHGCFLEEGRLWRDLVKIQQVPVILVNGRYDAICPPVTAYRLHRELPNSTLVIAEGAGHWMGDKPIEKALLKAARDMEAWSCRAPGER